VLCVSLFDKGSSLTRAQFWPAEPSVLQLFFHAAAPAPQSPYALHGVIAATPYLSKQVWATELYSCYNVIRLITGRTFRVVSLRMMRCVVLTQKRLVFSCRISLLIPSSKTQQTNRCCGL
jgi:hypothetical protein